MCRKIFVYGLCCAATLIYGVQAIAQPPQVPAYEAAGTISLPGLARWDYMSLDPRAGRLYVAHGDKVDVINVTSNKVVGEVAPTPGVHGIAIDRRDGLGFASAGGINSVVVFQLRSLKVLKNIAVGRMPDCIIYDRHTNRVFAFDGGSNEASVIDCKTQSLVGSVPLDGRPEFAVSARDGNVYVNIESKSEVARIDASALKVTAVWPLAPGEGPSGITIDTKRHLVFSTCHNGVMTVLNYNTGKVVATPAIGTGPDAAGFDAGFGLAFSSNGQGTISVLGEGRDGNFETVSTVITQPGARTMAVDTVTHNLYVCTATPDPAPLPPGTPFWRKPYLKDTFHILVLHPELPGAK